MREVKRDEMLNVNGGANPVLVASVIGIIVTFVIGVFHGYSNPKTCNK